MRESKDLERWFEENPIDKETVLQAEYLCDYYRKNNILLYQSEDKILKYMNQVLNVLDNSPEHKLTSTEITKELGGNWSDNEKDIVIQNLLDLDLIDQEIVKSANKPTTFYKLK